MPALFEDCARAESYVLSDPRSACFWARRAAERLVVHLYNLLDLRRPYRDDFAALTNDPGFKSAVGNAIWHKFYVIRRQGNDAVHDDRPVSRDAGLSCLTELHHVMVWAGFHHSANPAAVDLNSRFDAQLAARSAPLTRNEVAQLNEKFQAKDELLAAKDAEIAALQAQIKAAQDANRTPDDRDYNEAETRRHIIDVLLREAGWTLTDPRDREYPVTGLPNQSGQGFVDYVLWGEDGRPLAVIEAKRTARSPQVGQQQAVLYAEALERQFGRRPVIFYTSGYEHWLWDDAAGYPPREVQGFYRRDELELMIQRRTTARTLSSEPVNTDIAGRPYQIRAIKAVGDAFDARQREALLVMATGSGKTRTVIGLVEQLMKANWVKRVLFLADRTSLVTQATRAFTEHLGSVTTVNLVTEKATDGRVFASTYPTMLNLINETEGGIRRFGPGYFDLIVIDEAHRSVYAKYGAIFDYFDARLLGLTATPKDEIDHNTYRLFRLEDGVPTDAYGLDEAVADGWLVPPRGVSVQTKFLARGIRYDDLTEDEKDRWDALDWGEDDPPDEVNAEEINRFLFNEDTVDKVLGVLMEQGYRVAGGDRLGKTIIFARNQAHAEFIQDRFNRGWPEYAGRFARVITHDVSYAQSLIDDFSDPEKSPHIAISVDMLDTGIDVHDVVNLVFFKIVRSKSKFWQMIGRGTRLRPDLFGPGQDKRDFLVFDFLGNLEFFAQDLPGREGAIARPLSVRLFEARLALVKASEGQVRDDAARILREFVAGMTLDNVLVRPHRRTVEKFADESAWAVLTEQDASELMGIAGLPSSVRDEDEAAKRFDLVVLRGQLAHLESDAVTAERTRATVQAIASALLGLTTIPLVAAQGELLTDVAGDEWWIDVTVELLEHMRRRLRGIVRFVEVSRRAPIYTDFEDELGPSSDVHLPGVTTGIDEERFRAKASSYLRDHIDNVALQRLRRNRPLTPADLTALQGMLVDAGAGLADVQWVAERAGGLGLFVRSLVGLDRTAAHEAFADYLDEARFNVDQVRFVGLIVDELTSRGVVEPSRLFEAPFTDHAPTGPERVFAEADVVHIVDILRGIKANAAVG